MDAALDLARTMAAKDPLALRMTKEAINHSLGCAGFKASPGHGEPQPDHDDDAQYHGG